MPLTFIDIEKQKSWRIGAFFLFLLFNYFCIAVFFTAGIALYLHVPLQAAPRFLVFAGLTSLMIAGIHFWFSAYDAVNTVARSLDAQPPDPEDEVHATLINVMQEIHVVTGNKRKIQCFVVPSFSMNALAVADLKGEAAIAITEGLLSRLNRSQLESVLAHEAHHILSGDCLETSIAASLFSTFSSAIEKVGSASRGRAVASPTVLLAMASVKLTYLLNMFISRQREYRADAASVRMTRNPIALAEALHLLSRSWRGAGFISSGFEMLCIVNPQATLLDESEGFWADLLSTHPPLGKRMDILLKMARISKTELDARSERRADSKLPKTSRPLLFAMNPQKQWQGPFAVAELATLPWLSPLTWITQGNEQPVGRAWQDPLVNAIFLTRLASPGEQKSGFTCPSCHQPLVTASCEGTQVSQCRFCSGILASNARIPRIIARAGKTRPCSERITSLARAAVSGNMSRRFQKPAHGKQAAIPALPCPKCANPMFRVFYSQAHLIEIDRCSFCGLTWFDQDELQMLQCLIENRIVPEITVPEA